MKKRILFVDDELGVLQGLERSLRRQRKAWDMVFVESGREALRQAAERDFDAVVSDMRMPGMDGAELLGRLAADHPGLIRFILSGHSDEEMIIRSAGVAHQFLAKPCSADILKEKLNRAFTLKGHLGNGKLESFVTGLTSLPSIPRTYQEIRKKLLSPDASLHDIGEIVSADPAMTAKLLQLVNSAFFGLGRHISNSREAATLLGLDLIKALVLSVGIFSQFEREKFRFPDFSIESLAHHSLAVASLAKRIAEAEGMGKLKADDCFLAGMLHDAGMLILEQNLPGEYARVRALLADQEMELSEAEQEVLGANHGAVAAYLLGLWDLANPVVEAVAFHHQPELSSCDGFCPLAAVHVADVLVHQAGVFGSSFLIETRRFDLGFLARAGLTDRLDVWKKL